jgi:hypothetical protein
MLQKIHAQIVNPALNSSLGRGTNETGLTNAGNLVSAIISMLLIITTIASLIFFIVGGIGWVTSDGDKGKLETARNRILQAIVGLVIVASAWAVWLFVGKFIGIDFTNIVFPTL